MTDAQPDYEQFERRQLTQDQDNTQDRDNQRVQTVDADKSKARLIMQDLRAAGMSSQCPRTNGSYTGLPAKDLILIPLLVHFHQGWEATTDEA
ncbi:hypothetical protein Har1130_18695 [Haloarcula sp. CBA1130]|nr:hypothetical protein Har1130_18695 [Haloarcula sp. CBA1130]